MSFIPDDFAPNTQREWDMVRAHLLADNDWVCAYCAKPLAWKGSEIDHLIPRCQGGTDHFVNLTISCKSCNCAKGGRSVWQWTDPTDFAACNP